MNKYKYIGILDPKIAKELNIKEHENKPILVFDDRIKHVMKNHLKDFGSKESIQYIYDKLSIIIKKPDYVFFNKNTQGIEFYKKFDSNICVAVRISSGKTLKVRSWYPVKQKKILNRKKKDNFIHL